MTTTADPKALRYVVVSANPHTREVDAALLGWPAVERYSEALKGQGCLVGTWIIADKAWAWLSVQQWERTLGYQLKPTENAVRIL